MKASDLLCKILSDFGTSKVFGVTGGSILHPLQSAHQIGFDVYYTHHEQAASFAADASTRITNKPQACFVTTGPAGTNAMTGVLTSWLDSIPQIIISGQARLSDLTNKNSVRQIGTQHYDVINSIKNITNSYVQLQNESTFCQDILRTLYQSVSERPGPVWIDIPLDLQWADIKKCDYEVKNFDYFQSNRKKKIISVGLKINTDELIKNAIDNLLKANKPLVIIGAGCKQSKVGEELVKIFTELSIPMAFTWGSIDLLESKNDFNLGLIGINGERSANLAAYLADVIIGFGTHFSDQITGRERELFAPNAKKFAFDIDPKECERIKDFADVINIDLRTKLDFIIEYLKSKSSNRIFNKVNISTLKNLREFDQKIDPDEDYINIMRFYSLIYKVAPEESIFVSDGGGNTFFSSLQNLRIKKGQRSITSGGSGCMGSGLPQAIGAALSGNNKVFCFIGDGSMQFNIQELQTIKHHNLDITVLLINNSGYQAIIDTQNSYFDGNKFGVDSESGLSLPDFRKIVNAYEISYESFTKDYQLSETEIKRFCQQNSNPKVIEVFVKPNTPMHPKLSSGRKDKTTQMRQLPGIVAMDPQLPDETYKGLLAIKSW